MWTIKTLAAAAAVWAAAGASAAQELGALELTFDVGAKTGKVSAALFDSAEAYDGNGKAVSAQIVDLSSGAEPKLVFKGLKPGRYAVKAMHDLNGDGQMNTNPFGIPTEPYAFTNNAKGSFGPAKWDAASVEVTGAVAQTLVLK